jgi:hypothetical protein
MIDGQVSVYVSGWFDVSAVDVEPCKVVPGLTPRARVVFKGRNGPLPIDVTLTATEPVMRQLMVALGEGLRTLESQAIERALLPDVPEPVTAGSEETCSAS